MKYYVIGDGEIEFSQDASSRPQTKLMDKIGGLVWGLPAKKYPVCADCGAPQTFVAQFLHHPKRLDLGRDGRVLFVFSCFSKDEDCQTFDPESGANACFILEPEELKNDLTPLPDPRILFHLGTRITEWRTKEDDVTDDLAQPLLEGNSLLTLVPEDKLNNFNLSTGTKLGSVPTWLQSLPQWFHGSTKDPLNGWKFIGQLDANDEDFTSNAELLGLYEIWGGGVGYIFTRVSDDPSAVPEAMFFYQST